MSDKNEFKIKFLCDVKTKEDNFPDSDDDDDEEEEKEKEGQYVYNKVGFEMAIYQKDEGSFILSLHKTEGDYFIYQQLLRTLIRKLSDWFIIQIENHKYYLY